MARHQICCNPGLKPTQACLSSEYPLAREHPVLSQHLCIFASLHLCVFQTFYCFACEFLARRCGFAPTRANQLHLLPPISNDIADYTRLSYQQVRRRWPSFPTLRSRKMDRTAFAQGSLGGVFCDILFTCKAYWFWNCHSLPNYIYHPLASIFTLPVPRALLATRQARQIYGP